MPKILKIILILAVMAGIIAVGVFFVTRAYAIHKIKSGHLTSCRYSYGGGMDGGGWSLAVSRDRKTGVVTFVTTERGAHYLPETKTTYTVDEACLDELQKLVTGYKLYNAEKRPMGPQVMDGATGSFSCMYDNYAMFHFGTYQLLTKRDREGLEKILDYMRSLPAAEGSSEPVTETEPHQLRLSVDGYNLFFDLNESRASEALLAELSDVNGSSKYEFSHYSDNEVIFYPKSRLDVSGCPPAESGKAGTLCYYEPWGNVVFFYDAFSPAEGLFELGSLENPTSSALELLKNMEPGDYYVTQAR